MARTGERACFASRRFLPRPRPGPTGVALAFGLIRLARAVHLPPSVSAVTWKGLSFPEDDGGDRPHPSRLVVLERLDDLGPVVHHERPVVRDRLSDRQPSQEQELGRGRVALLAIG